MLKVTYYLEVVSSWCHWAEPAWAELKNVTQTEPNFNGRSRSCRRRATQFPPANATGFIGAAVRWCARPICSTPAGWKRRLSSTWCQLPCPGQPESLGVTDDRVRLAIANAGLRDGQKVGRWEVALDPAAEAAQIDPAKLLARAQSPETATPPLRRRLPSFTLFRSANAPLSDRKFDRRPGRFSGSFVQILWRRRSMPCFRRGGIHFMAAHFGGPPSS